MTSPKPASLRAYRALSRWLPFYHLDEKLAGLFFCALLLPLLTLIACVLAGDALSARAAVIPVLVATLCGAGAALWAVQELLAPLRLGQDALRHRNGPPLPTDLSDDMGQLLRDLRRMREAGATLEQDSRASSLDDPLSGLPSARLSSEYLRLCGHAVDRSGSKVSVALIDPDAEHRMGATTSLDGDRVVRELGGFLKRWLNRRSDWVGRWSGDQFVAVMFSEQSHAVDYLEQLRREFSRQMLGLAGSSLSVAVAVTELRVHETAAELIGRLEAELRDARFQQLESALPPASDKVHSLAAALRRQRGR